MRGRALWIGALVWALVVSVAPIVIAEDAPPHVRINAPDGGSTVRGTVDITGNAWDDMRVAGVKVHIDDGEWHHATDTSANDTWWSWSYEWDTTTVDNGWHGIGALAHDSSGQAADDRVEVYVDNDVTHENRAPWVEIDSPPGGSTVNGTVLVEGRAGDEDDNDTVELVQVRIDVGEWTNATPTGDNGSFAHWSYEWNTTTYDEGWHVFRARAYDGSDYTDPPAAKEYFVDNIEGGNTAPFAEIRHPRNGETVSGIVLVHGVAGDPDENDTVEVVEVRIGDGDWRSAVDTSHDDTWSTWALQWDTTKTDNGERHVCARSSDGELYSEEDCRVVKVKNEHDNHRPEVKILHPSNGEKVAGLVLIHGKSWDDGGVELVEVRFGDGEWHEATDTSPDDSWTTWALEWDTTKRDDGCVVVAARAWDGTLFSEIHRIEVCVDNHNDPPTVEIVNPEEGDVVHGLVLVHGTSHDDVAVKLVQVRIDDGEWHKAVDTGRERRWSTWAWEWDTRDHDNGRHEVCARAWDGEKYSEVDCVVVVVENVPGGAPPAPRGDASPFLAFGLFLGLGVAILMWLRSHAYIRK